MSLGDLEQLVLLAILRLSPEAYGISVQQEIAARARPDVTLGAVYSTLTRLEQKGMVAAKIGSPTPVRGGRRKKLYLVTGAGREAIRDSLHALRSLSRGLTPGLGMS
jgi:DNA-binding PadR family transcriptional regulator